MATCGLPAVDGNARRRRNGRALNGPARFDFTNHFEIAGNKLETMLWPEADSMRSLQIAQDNLTHQQAVTNEVKVAC